jgi:hypothetical protein
MEGAALASSNRAPPTRRTTSPIRTANRTSTSTPSFQGSDTINPKCDLLFPAHWLKGNRQRQRNHNPCSVACQSTRLLWPPKERSQKQGNRHRAQSELGLFAVGICGHMHQIKRCPISH